MRYKNSLLSVIIPVHNESANLVWHHKRIVQAMEKIGQSSEIIYVDDGSTDDSRDILKELIKTSTNTRLIALSRNFGKEAATSAGLKKCNGDAALMIDADGQHPIEAVGKFLDKWHEGYQVVIGIRKSNTKEGIVKHYGSKLFYQLLSSMADGKTIPNSTDFRLLDRRVIDEFNKLTEHNRITRGLIDWLGFRSTTIDFDSPARHSGTASYSFTKLVKLALYSFVSQSTKPLQFVGFLGGLTVILSAIIGIFLLIEKYTLGDPMNLAVTGSALLALFVSFLVGLVLICQWLLALYIESIHSETQNRPLYVVDEEL
ncbi:MAG: glycosyltransferase family 2 protein [Candidatus Saccharimonadales bacterium]